MKKFSFTIIVLLISAGSFCSCMEKTDKDETGNVIYKPCLCEEDKSLAELQFHQGEAYMFKDSIPERMDYQIRTELSDASYAIYWIVFDSKTYSACLTVGEKSIRNICEICNFPDFIREWDIPENGCKVYFEGIAYEPCVSVGGIGTVSYFDYVLTSFKKK